MAAPMDIAGNSAMVSFSCTYIIVHLTVSQSVYIIVKLVFEIAVDRQTRTLDQAVRGTEFKPPTGARCATKPIFGPFLT